MKNFTKHASHTGSLWVMLLFAVTMLGCQPKVLVKSSVQGVDQPVKAVEGTDAEITQMIAPFKEKLDKGMSDVVAVSAQRMFSQPVECNLGNFMADLMQVQGTKEFGKPVDMGVMTNGGLRKPIAKGPITTRDVYELMPFDNRVYILELNGEQVMQLMQYLVDTRLASVSNTYVHAINGKIDDLEIGGKPFDPSRTYTVSVSNYLAGGGDKMFFFRDCRVLKASSYNVRDAIFDYLKSFQSQGKPVEAKVEGRVKID
ncbi:5'-nucleotidase [Persicobacter psychrovividus]|uniref:5'-Nucleotidase C-terminal domain-containing protein n=1 Tax=Persicobacter psychrovividus TaxID=387638 RepID=A0ABM7VG67_9BACT|nr:hypothetical protein PEPS_22350 [Persicobacter psychrovividus]